MFCKCCYIVCIFIRGGLAKIDWLVLGYIVIFIFFSLMPK